MFLDVDGMSGNATVVLVLVFLLFVLGVQLIRVLALANRNLFRNIHTNTYSADFSQS